MNKMNHVLVSLLLSGFIAMFFVCCGLKKQEKQPKVEFPPVIQNLINDMITIEGGTFLMGAHTREEEQSLIKNCPLHNVTLSTFLIGKYEVTQEQWIAVMGSNPSWNKNDRCPVENVTFHQIKQFIERLNAMTQMQFRLPTEAEWEFAARGGNLSKGYLYSGSNNPKEVAWCGGWSGHKTNHVGSMNANELGLHDMSGNVAEMCSDLYNYYTSEDQINPQGPHKSVGGLTNQRVVRGGAYGPPSYVAIRTHISEDTHDGIYGFRLAL